MKKNNRDKELEARIENIKLTNQSFQEAGGMKVYPNLEQGNVILMQVPYKTPSLIVTPDFDKGMGTFLLYAVKQNYSHIFKVELICDARSNYWFQGTGYKPKKE